MPTILKFCFLSNEMKFCYDVAHACLLMLSSILLGEYLCYTCFIYLIVESGSRVLHSSIRAGRSIQPSFCNFACSLIRDMCVKHYQYSFVFLITCQEE